MTAALLLVGHGTRSAVGAAECATLADRVRRRRPGLPVTVGNLELRRPTIAQAVDELGGRGAADITAVPLVLFAARHAKQDIPEAIDEERRRRPDLRLRLGAPLGVHPDLVAVVGDRLAAVGPARQAAGKPAGQVAVVLARAGSTDPDALPDVAAVGRLLGRCRPGILVDTAFAGIARPRVDEALDRCRRRGACRLVVVPYLLFAGELATRIGRQAAGFAAEHPDVTVATAGHLGPDERIADLVLQRYDEARAASGDTRGSAPPGDAPRISAAR